MAFLGGPSSDIGAPEGFVKTKVSTLSSHSAGALDSGALSGVTEKLHGTSAIRHLKSLGEGVLLSPLVMLSADGHFHNLYGVYTQKSTRYYQVSHGTGDPELLNDEELADLDVAAVWLRKDAELPLSRVSVGSAELTIAPRFCNMGFMSPAERKSCSVSVSNVGGSSIDLESVHTTCGCTSAAFENNAKRLDPGSTVLMTVSLSSSVLPPIHETVRLTLRDSASGESTVAALDVVGCKFPTKKLSGRTLPLGSARRGDTAMAVYRLSEVPTDRFTIVDVRASNLPIEHEISTQVDSTGLATYRVSVRCDTTPFKPGAYEGSLIFTTTSESIPTVLVPLSVRVLPDVQFRPEQLAFDAVNQGDEAISHIAIFSPLGSSITSVRPMNVRSDMTVTVGSPIADEVPVEVRWRWTKPFDGSRTLLLAIATSDGNANLTLHCSRSAH